MIEIQRLRTYTKDTKGCLPPHRAYCRYSKVYCDMKSATQLAGCRTISTYILQLRTW